MSCHYTSAPRNTFPRSKLYLSTSARESLTHCSQIKRQGLLRGAFSFVTTERTYRRAQIESNDKTDVQSRNTLHEEQHVWQGSEHTKHDTRENMYGRWQNWKPNQTTGESVLSPSLTSPSMKTQTKQNWKPNQTTTLKQPRHCGWPHARACPVVVMPLVATPKVEAKQSSKIAVAGCTLGSITAPRSCS